MTDLVLINSPMQVYDKKNKPSYETTAPLGLGYLATVCGDSGLSVKLIDAEAEKLSPDEIIKRASGYNPKTLGINSFSTNQDISIKLLRGINAEYKLLGGPYATGYTGSSYPDFTLVRGEAENVILSLLKQRPQGIVDAGKVLDLDSLPFINRSFFVNDPYNASGFTESSILTSRGCLYNCAYCSTPALNGRSMRARSIDNVMEEIELLDSSGVSSIHIVDDLFNFSKERVREFCLGLRKRDLNINWRALCRIENLDNSLLEEMRASGAYKLAFGVESASPKVLNYIGKTSDLEKVKNVFDTCKKLGIKTKGFFTIGYPSETTDDIKRTIDFAVTLNPDEARFMVVRAFPGTRLFNDLKNSGWTEKQLTEYRQFHDIESYVKYHVMNVQSLNGMSAEELDGYIREAYSLTSKK